MEQTARARNVWVAGLVIGGLIASLGPLIGALLTVVGIVHAFEATSAAPPSSRAAELSSEIETAMTATVGGMCVGVLGILIAGACVLMWNRGRTLHSSLA